MSEEPIRRSPGLSGARRKAVDLTQLGLVYWTHRRQVNRPFVPNPCAVGTPKADCCPNPERHSRQAGYRVIVWANPRLIVLTLCSSNA